MEKVHVTLSAVEFFLRFTTGTPVERNQSTTEPSAPKPPAPRNLCPPANSVLVANPLSAWVIRGESVARFLLSIPHERRPCRDRRAQRMAMAHLFAILLSVFAIASSAMNGHLSDSLSGTRDLIVKSFEWFGNLTIFFGRVVRAVFLPPYQGREFVHQFDELGSKSLPLVALAGAATGRRSYALHAGQPYSLRSQIISSRRRRFLDHQGERSDHHGAGSERSRGCGHRRRTRRDEGDRADRCNGGFGRRPVQVSSGNTRSRLHVDASAAHLRGGFLWNRHGLGRQYSGGADLPAPCLSTMASRMLPSTISYRRR